MMLDITDEAVEAMCAWAQYSEWRKAITDVMILSFGALVVLCGCASIYLAWPWIVCAMGALAE